VSEPKLIETKTYDDKNTVVEYYDDGSMVLICSGKRLRVASKKVAVE
jgi:uncharacterized protein YacL